MAQSSGDGRSVAKGPKAPVPAGWIELGYLARPHGVRGQLKVRLFNPDASLLRGLRKVHLLDDDGRLEEVGLRAVSAEPGGGARVSLEGVQGRERAEGLVGRRMLVAEADLPALEPDTYYHHQLIGLRAEDPEGHALGILEEVFETGANDVYVIRAEGQEELLVPAIGTFVQEVDLAGRRLVVANVDDLR